MHIKRWKELVVFHDSDLPNMATHCKQSQCGFSLYQGVLIQWDEDEDERILTFIDQLSDDLRENLLVAQEHEGSLGLIWKDYVPHSLRENGGDVIVEGDYWTIFKSVAASEEMRADDERLERSEAAFNEHIADRHALCDEEVIADEHIRPA